MRKLNKEEIAELPKLYESIINKLISNNVEFYRFSETIKWCFGFDDKTSIVAETNRKNNVITINIKAFMRSLFEDNLITIEYFLLHEIRHVFQHLIISDFESGLDLPISEEIVKKWKYEGDHYIKSLLDNGEENPKYFMQDSEMDAYAFSLSVMEYKYKQNKIKHLYIPPVYGHDFRRLVEEWKDTFEKENIQIKAKDKNL